MNAAVLGAAGAAVVVMVVAIAEVKFSSPRNTLAGFLKETPIDVNEAVQVWSERKAAETIMKFWCQERDYKLVMEDSYPGIYHGDLSPESQKQRAVICAHGFNPEANPPVAIYQIEKKTAERDKIVGLGTYVHRSQCKDMGILGEKLKAVVEMRKVNGQLGIHWRTEKLRVFISLGPVSLETACSWSWK